MYSDVPVCPVLWLNYYIAACKALGVLHLGEYFFRSLVHKAVSHCPLGGSAISVRLHKYLKYLLSCVVAVLVTAISLCLFLFLSFFKAAAIDDGETPHSFRFG